MKLSKELYGELLAGIRWAVEELGGRIRVDLHREALAKEPRYQPGGAGDLEMRIRWDVYRAWERMSRTPTTPFDETWLGHTYAEGCVDSHVDTALKNVLKELGL